jgi:hypothetical protein
LWQINRLDRSYLVQIILKDGFSGANAVAAAGHRRGEGRRFSVLWAQIEARDIQREGGI